MDLKGRGVSPGLVDYPAIYSVYKPERSEAEVMECERRGIGKFLCEGVTCVHDNFADSRSFKVYRQLEQSGELALRVYTLGTAHAAFDERELGSLEVGKAADFVVWNRDLTTVSSAADVKGLAVQATYIGGKAV